MNMIFILSKNIMDFSCMHHTQGRENFVGHESEIFGKQFSQLMFFNSEFLVAIYLIKYLELDKKIMDNLPR